MIIRSRKREPGEGAFFKKLPPPDPLPQNFDWWGGRAKGVRSSGKLKRGERFLERLFQQAAPPELGIIQAGPLAISRENRQQGFDKVKSL